MRTYHQEERVLVMAGTLGLALPVQLRHRQVALAPEREPPQRWQKTKRGDDDLSIVDDMLGVRSGIGLDSVERSWTALIGGPDRAMPQHK